MTNQTSATAEKQTTVIYQECRVEFDGKVTHVFDSQLMAARLAQKLNDACRSMGRLSDPFKVNEVTKTA